MSMKVIKLTVYWDAADAQLVISFIDELIPTVMRLSTCIGDWCRTIHWMRAKPICRLMTRLSFRQARTEDKKAGGIRPFWAQKK